MGDTAYATGEPIRQGARVYAHSRKDGQEGLCWLVVNNSNESTTLELPKAGKAYILTGDGKLRSRVMCLNGKPLTLGENDELPSLEGMDVPAGNLEIPATGCAFIVL